MDLSNKENSEKRTRRRLTLAQRFQVIEDAENGMRNKDLAEKYQVHRSTITLTLINKDKILKRKEIIGKYNTNKEFKKYSQVNESVFEKSVYMWLNQKRALGEHVTGSSLRAVAKDLHKRFHGETNFSASEGWLERFKKRHGIRFNVKGDKPLAGDDDTTTFRTALQDFIKKNGYELDNIYNADESTLFWKEMPNKIVACRQKTQVPRRTVPKDRIIIQVCCNASGSHKLPLTIIGKSLYPQSLRDISIAVIYMSQKKSLMDRKVFLDWYTHVFLPSVKERNPDPDARFLLILDNAPVHLSQKQLNAIDPQCFVYYLSPHVSALTQPMEQGVISSLKRTYKSSFLFELVAQDFYDEESVANFLEKWTLGECCYLLANAWSDVSLDILKNAWRNLLQYHFADGSVEESSESCLTRFPQLMNLIPGCDLLTLNEIENWVEKDGLEPPWKSYSSEKIAKLAENSDDEIFNDNSDDELQSSDNVDNDDMNLNDFLEMDSEIPHLTEESTEDSSSVDEFLQHVMRIRDWSRKNNQITIAANCDTLKENLLCIKLDDM